MNLEQIKSKQLESDIASLHGMHTFQKRPGNRPLKEQTRPTDIAFLSAKLSQAERISGDLKNKLKNVVRERDSLSKDLLSRPSSGSFDDLVLSLSLSLSLSLHTHTHTHTHTLTHRYIYIYIIYSILFSLHTSNPASSARSSCTSISA